MNGEALQLYEFFQDTIVLAEYESGPGALMMPNDVSTADHLPD